MKLNFAVFVQDDAGPLYRCAFVDLEQAKKVCMEIAKDVGLDCSIYSYETFNEVARFSPDTHPTMTEVSFPDTAESDPSTYN